MEGNGPFRTVADLMALDCRENGWKWGQVSRPLEATVVEREWLDKVIGVGLEATAEDLRVSGADWLDKWTGVARRSCRTYRTRVNEDWQ